MKVISTFSLLSLLITFELTAQVNLTPVTDLNLQQVKVEIPSQFVSMVDTSRFYVNLPAGYKARLFYTGGLVKPRFMAFDPDGILHVSDMGGGKVYAMPDMDNDGMADTAMVVASGFVNNHDVKFYQGAMYVTEPTRVIKLTDGDNDGIYENRSDFITGIPGGGNHITRTIVFDPASQKAYLSIGSSCNVCRETDRAIIEQYNDDGTGKRTYAYGVRNAVGMTLHPVTNRLWANNNGSDWQGNEIPPEWIDIVRDSGFYGHPFAYADKVWFDFDAHSDYQALKPITATDSMHVSRMIEPAALIRAHSAPMAIEFLNSSFPTPYQNGFLMSLHGSWNTPQGFRGYKIVYMDLSNANDTTVNYVADFVSGFLEDTVQRRLWARPVGLAIANDGSFYMTSDDSNTFVMQIYESDTTTGLIEDVGIKSLKAYPNPFADVLNISFVLDQTSHIRLRLWDITGKLVSETIPKIHPRGYNQISITTEGLNEGMYIYELISSNATERGRIMHMK